MTDYSKMTKAELIEVIELLELGDTFARDRIANLERSYEKLDREYYDLLNSAPNTPSGWWLGFALFAAMIIPWFFIAMWVMG